MDVYPGSHQKPGGNGITGQGGAGNPVFPYVVLRKIRENYVISCPAESISCAGD
jgi:hypothetical protein